MRSEGAAGGTGSSLWLYELVPLVELPELDLSISIKSRFVRSARVLRIMSVMIDSPFTFLAYVAYIILCLIAFVTPSSTGRVIAVVAFMIGIVPAVISFSMLRYEMVVMLCQTYDIWFFGVLSTVVSIVLVLLLNDVRGLLMFHSWVLFVFNIFIDANLFNMRRIWIGNVMSIAMCLTIALCVSGNITDALHQFDVLTTKTKRSLSASSVARDGLLSMTAVVLRNVFRQRHYVSRKVSSSASTPSIPIAAHPPRSAKLVTCMSLRCRLQIRPLAIRSPLGSSKMNSSSGSKTQLHLGAFVDVVDVRNTIVPLPSWFWSDNRRHPSQTKHVVWLRRVFALIGCVGFAVLHTAIGLQVIDFALASPSPLDFLVPIRRSLDLLIAIGFSMSLTFTGVCMMLCQRQLLWAVFTSFDFVFNVGQITIMYLCVSYMYRWERTMLVPLFACWMWTVWVMSWDAMTPPIRRRLGLAHQHSASAGTALIVFVLVSGVLIFGFVPLHTVNDDAIWSSDVWGLRIEFYTISWYINGTATVIVSAIRIVWRKWTAAENDLVFLDGPVVYQHQPRSHPFHSTQQLTSVEPTTTTS